ncbi:divalent-cation tolerance protein CutA [Candidatus Berkiella cookevillensis]|uniref:Divalent-cation tolerance protein CutA n=1 Tax=Candidatus Berkiella cookevillensis TaxID=437022 RepID=A0A0Q9YAN4_9GAMM|nr:divalent-cation tolerance protein CutA [Candidatus Berkiella cookevillensis]MCS5709533.1 divalent-cation tolerance protein CutA [Candidatus Berkiella cookevillensis]
MSTDYCVIYCTCPNQETAENLSALLLEKRLVACLNIVPNLSSHYIWQGKITKGEELLLVMKTKTSKLTQVEGLILEVHPYEFPEFIAMPIIYGNRQYLDWVNEVVD